MAKTYGGAPGSGIVGENYVRGALINSVLYWNYVRVR